VYGYFGWLRPDSWTPDQTVRHLLVRNPSDKQEEASLFSRFKPAC